MSKRRARSYDESDARVRAPRSKPRRSKDRPDYTGAPIAFVTTVDRGRITCLTDAKVTVTAMKARELGKNSVVVGDLIRLDGDVSGSEGSLARAVEVMPRKNLLSRTVDDIGAFEKSVAANVDQLVIVVAAADPTPRHGFVDRCLVVAYDQGIEPLLVITKSDLTDPAEFLQSYEALDISTFVLSVKAGDIKTLTSLREKLSGKKSVLIGHSGVGKSTLFNALLNNQSRATGDVNFATGKGRHTSSSAYALELPDGGWIFDTPGVRSFGLEHVDQSRVIGAFEELAEAIVNCPKNCSHLEAGCALNNIPSEGKTVKRVEGLRRILSSSSQPIT
ncbi:MAG: ribosome small subunit-dependent GTPase A [Actinobacteria bacterium]|nr:ribosome small subunit-dependent GTPase A [Actinomycetota bacterium]